MKLKIFTGIILTSFFVFMTALITAGSILLFKNKDEGNISEVDINDISDKLISENDVSFVLDETEVSKHSTADDCFLIINSNVYDVSSFVSMHPGGGFLIEAYCGKDATIAFETRDRKPPQKHSNFAADLLRKYYLGPIGKVFENTPKDLGLGNGEIINIGNPNQITPTTSFSTQTNQLSNKNLVLTTAEVANHNTLQNCWIIISGNVYDVTKFVYQHPGGVTEISSRCGTDATNAFQTLGGRGKNHSNLAYSMLASYLIGSVGSSIDVTTPATTLQNPVNNTNNTTIQNSTIPQSVYSVYPDATSVSGGYEDDGRWEGKINSSSGCREIKVSSDGSLLEDKKC